MDYEIEQYKESFLNDICEIWNEAIVEGGTLHWIDVLPKEKIAYILSTQTVCFCATANDKCIGFYILHPNGSGCCDHIANALYIVSKDCRNNGIGTSLVNHSLEKAQEHGFRAMQYNSVVASNRSVDIYLKVGFEKVGVIPDGFILRNNTYDDLLILYKRLVK